MTLQSIITAADDRLIALLELSHPAWPAPLRYADATEAWTVTQDGGPVTYPATPFEREAGSLDDTGQDSRLLRVPDASLVLWRRCLALVGVVDGGGVPVPVQAVIREYAASSLAAPLRVSRLELRAPRSDGLSVSFTAESASVGDRAVTLPRFTSLNSPGLRR